MGSNITWQINPTKKSFGRLITLVKSLDVRPKPKVNIINARAIGAITNPISLPLSIFSKGNRKNFQYSILTINKENGRIAQRGINLYSQKDIKYLNDYLNLSTGYNSSEQLTSEELGSKYLLLKQKEVLPSSINCDYMEKYGQIRTKKSSSRNLTKTSIKVNCNSPVWKKRPECK